MKKMTEKPRQACVCGSAKEAADCCLALINGSRVAENAEQLMRSRYTAYALKNVQYVMDSWHVSTRPSEFILNDFPKWAGLKVLNVKPEKAGESYVEFVAAFYDESNNMGQMHERSRFLREEGRWFYVDGEQLASAAQYHFSPPGRNEPCYCGSGRKFKKCCANLRQ